MRDQVIIDYLNPVAPAGVKLVRANARVSCGLAREFGGLLAVPLPPSI